MSEWEEESLIQLFFCTSLWVSTCSIASVSKWFCLCPPKAHLEELCHLWDLLLELMQEKGNLLLQILKFQQYLQECEDILEWIGDKVKDRMHTGTPSLCPRNFTATHCRLLTKSSEYLFLAFFPWEKGKFWQKFRGILEIAIVGSKPKPTDSNMEKTRHTWRIQLEIWSGLIPVLPSVIFKFF